MLPTSYTSPLVDSPSGLRIPHGDRSRLKRDEIAGAGAMTFSPRKRFRALHLMKEYAGTYLVRGNPGVQLR